MLAKYEMDIFIVRTKRMHSLNIKEKKFLELQITRARYTISVTYGRMDERTNDPPIQVELHFAKVTQVK